MKKAIIVMLIFLFGGASAAFGQKPKPSAKKTVPVGCVHRVWVEDPDPAPTNIRDAPGLNGKVIDQIADAVEPEDEVMLDVIGYSNGWLKISFDEGDDSGGTAEKFGWISAKKVAFAIETNDSKPAPLYARPTRSGKKIGTVPLDAHFLIVGYDCFGFKIAYQGKTGWIAADDMCGNPLTTCP
jgi:hypothetical protein